METNPVTGEVTKVTATHPSPLGHPSSGVTAVARVEESKLGDDFFDPASLDDAYGKAQWTVEEEARILADIARSPLEDTKMKILAIETLRKHKKEAHVAAGHMVEYTLSGTKGKPTDEIQAVARTTKMLSQMQKNQKESTNE